MAMMEEGGCDAAIVDDAGEVTGIIWDANLIPGPIRLNWRCRLVDRAGWQGIDEGIEFVLLNYIVAIV
jgi:hypothetical protein